MNSELEIQSNAERIYQSIEEVRTSLSALEEKIRLGGFAVQSETETNEMVRSDENSLGLEAGSFPKNPF